MPHPSHHRQAAYRKRKATLIKRFSTYIPAPLLDQARQQSVLAGVSFPAYLVAALHHFQGSQLSFNGEEILALASDLGADFNYKPHAAHKKKDALQ